jgi:hypothetical protein
MSSPKPPTDPRPPCSVCGDTTHTKGYHDSKEPAGYHDSTPPVDANDN